MVRFEGSEHPFDRDANELNTFPIQATQESGSAPRSSLESDVLISPFFLEYVLLCDLRLFGFFFQTRYQMLWGGTDIQSIAF